MKKRIPRFIALGLLLSGLFVNSVARAQVFDPNAPATRSSAEILADTTERREVVVTPTAKRQKAAADSAKRTEHMFRAFGYPGIRLTRPGKAALLAAILPGAGQIYNRRLWKLPLVYGAVGGTIAGEIFYQQRYRQFADAYNNLTNPTAINPSTNVRYQLGDELLGPQARTFKTIDAINNGIVFYRGYRDIFYLYIGIAYSLQIVDALVDAHLQDFDVSTDLSLHWEPQLLPTPGQPWALPTNPGVLFALRVR
ncbi:DUF5683 domain-containing protein [Hymenobacter sp. UYCo722]|uniref:DUF5683 domain-containing protein n=1 Tax=Hymenobacter sp. UYCo722 TaxID=3156335 RepID=UPI00339A6B5C